MNLLGVTGYGIVGALYALLALLLMLSWRGKPIGVLLIGATLTSAAWGCLLAVHLVHPVLGPVSAFVLEVARLGVWLLFLGRLLQEMRVAGRLALGVVIGWAALLVAGPVINIVASPDAAPALIGETLYYGGLAAALAGLVLVEQVFRNAVGDLRRRLQYLVIGVGGIFAYDLFLYSQAVLFQAIDPTTWQVRGVVNALFVPMIAVAARRNSDWAVRIFVSRQVVFYSTTLVAAGLYLLLMASGGYLLLQFGGDWGAAARLIFFAGAGVVLVALLFSNSLRGRLKVFLNKHFFHNKYDHREEWLRLVATLAEFDDSSTRRVVIRAVAQIVGSPGGMLWIRDARDGRFRLSATLDADVAPAELPTGDAIVEFVQRDGWVIDLAEYRREPTVYGALAIPDWLQQIDKAWLLIPLTSRGELLGLMLLFEADGPPRLNYEDRDLLKTAASHVAVHLAQERSDSLLAEAQQFEAYNRLTAFLMHDLNNLIAQQSLIVANADKHKRNPDFVDDAIATIAGSVDRMKRVMKQLKGGGADVPVAKPTEARFIVSAAVDRCAEAAPSPTLELNGVKAQLAVDAEQFTMVLTHLIRNAQEATPAHGEVRVSLRERGGELAISVEDNGSGMTDEFVRERLFRPFDSTKGSQGMGIGAYQAREFARTMGGELTVTSAPSRGTTVTMTLPIEPR